MRMLQVKVLITVVIGAATLSLAAPAAVAKTKVTVLDFEASPGAEKVAQRITKQLRRTVANTRGLRIVTGKPLMEVKFLFGCSDPTPAAYHPCIAKAGMSFKADHVVLGKVFKRGRSYKVTLKLIDVKRPLRPKIVSGQLGRRQIRGSALKAAVSGWFGSLLGRSAKGTISFTCNLEGVSVKVNGQDAASCGASSTKLKLKPGTYTLTFSKGDQSKTRTISIQAGRTESVNVKLEIKTSVPPRRVEGTPPVRRKDGVTPPPKGGPTAKKDGRLVWKVLFFSTLSVGVGLLVGSIATGLKVKSLEGDKRSYIRNIPPGDPYPDVGNACKFNAGHTRLVNICNDGVRMANVTNALIPLGAIFVGVSGYFLYRAYFKKSKSSTERPSTTGTFNTNGIPTLGLSVQPYIGPRGGGVSATLEF